MIAISIEIRMYFTNMYGFASTYAVFKCMKPKISIIWLKTLNGCDNMTSAQRVWSGSAPAKARKQILIQ